MTKIGIAETEQSIESIETRQTVFISHANSEDNEFAAWLELD